MSLCISGAPNIDCSLSCDSSLLGFSNNANNSAEEDQVELNSEQCGDSVETVWRQLSKVK